MIWNTKKERERERGRERERPGVGPNECLEEGYNLLMVPYSGNHSSSQWTSNFMTKCISPSTLPKERVCVCGFVCDGQLGGERDEHVSKRKEESEREEGRGKK